MSFSTEITGTPVTCLIKKKVRFFMIFTVGVASKSALRTAIMVTIDENTLKIDEKFQVIRWKKVCWFL